MLYLQGRGGPVKIGLDQAVAFRRVHRFRVSTVACGIGTDIVVARPPTRRCHILHRDPGLVLRGVWL